MATIKKVTKVSGGENIPQKNTFVPTAEAKKKASQLRLYAVVLWVLAIIAQGAAMFILFKKDPEIDLSTGNRIALIAILLVDLILLIIGSWFWKKSNRFDPASKKDSFKFALQSQLGVVMAVVAFLPVVVLAFIKKEYLIGAIAAAFMIGGGLASADYSPPSVEEYSKQSSYVKELMGADHVYGTKSGTKYHLYDDCQYLKSDRTVEIFEGTVADLYANNSRIKPEMSSLCSACEKRAAKEKGWSDEQMQQEKDKIINSILKVN